jgi:hypothetical protein
MRRPVWFLIIKRFARWHPALSWRCKRPVLLQNLAMIGYISHLCATHARPALILQPTPAIIVWVTFDLPQSEQNMRNVAYPGGHAAETDGVALIGRPRTATR